MTEEQFDLLIKLIDAKIAEHSASVSWDGGLHEAVVVNIVEEQLRAILVKDNSDD